MVCTHDQTPQKTDVIARCRKRSCLPLSCFGSPVSDPDAEKEKLVVGAGSRKTASLFLWSRFRKKKKTVPMDASAAAESNDKVARDRHVKKTDFVTEEGEKLRRRRPTEMPVVVQVPGQAFFQKLQKVGWKGGRGCKRRLCEPPKAHVRESNRLPLPSAISAGNDPRSRPGSPGNVHARAGPSHPGAPETNPTSSSSSSLVRRKLSQQTPGASRLSSMKSRQKKRDESVGRRDPVVALVVVLAMMIVGGRIWAIICTSAWFYFLPWLRAPASDTGREMSGERKESAVIDFNSVEYKKKVILEGLLERNGRKPSGILYFFS